MRISGINNNTAFKSLHFGPLTKEHDKNIISPNIMKLNNIAKNAEVFIKSENFVMERGSDYEIYTKALKVSVSPIRDIMSRAPQIGKNSDILAMSFTFRPNNNNGDDFISYVKEAVDTITK